MSLPKKPTFRPAEVIALKMPVITEEDFNIWYAMIFDGARTGYYQSSYIPVSSVSLMKRASDTHQCLLLDSGPIPRGVTMEEIAAGLDNVDVSMEPTEIRHLLERIYTEGLRK